MIPQESIQFLIDPNTSTSAIHQFLLKNRIKDLPEVQITDVQKIKITIEKHKTLLKKEILQVLCYRAGKVEMAQSFDPLKQQVHKLNLLLQLADPTFTGYRDSRKAEFVVYHQILAALGVDKVIDLPMWLQLKMLKAFKLQLGALNNEEFNHMDANAEGFDVEQLMRLAKDCCEGLSKKPATEKLALACWAATDNQEALSVYQETHSQASMSVAKGHRYAAWFKAYATYPQPLLNKIAKAYSKPQEGLAPNLFAAALCYACVLRVEPQHVEAKQGLLACFNKGDENLWANVQALPQVEAIGTAKSRQAAKEVVKHDPLINDKTFFVTEIPGGVATKGQAEAEQKRMENGLRLETLDMRSALSIFGMTTNFLNDFSLYGSRAGEKSILQQAIAKREAAWQKAFKTKLAANNADQRQVPLVFRRQVKQQVDEFAVLLEKLMAEACQDENSFGERLPAWLNQVEKLCKREAGKADFQEIDRCLWGGVSLLDEAKQLLLRLKNIDFCVSALPKDVNGARVFIRRLSDCDSILLRGIESIYNFYLEHLDSLMSAKEVLAKYSDAINEGSYTTQQEQQLFDWMEGKKVSRVGKIFSASEKKVLSGTFAKFTATTTALAKLFDRAQAATHTQKDILLEAINTQSVFATLATIEEGLAKYEALYQTFLAMQTFLQAEQAAKTKCLSLKVNARQGNATWQATHQQILVFQAVDDLRRLIPKEQPLWRGLIAGVNTLDGEVDCTQGRFSRSIILAYLGFDPRDLPFVLSFADKEKAFAAIKAEYTAYKALVDAIAADNIYYPPDAGNQYVQMKQGICKISFIQQKPGHFAAKLTEYTRLQQAESDACDVMNKLITQHQQELAYHNPRTLREGLNKLLKTQTYAQAKEKFRKIVAGEANVKRFLQAAGLLFDYADVNILKGQFYIEKLNFLPKVAKLLYQNTQEMSDTELQAELEKQQQKKVIFDGLKENYQYWFENDSPAKRMAKALVEGDKDYVAVVAIINASIMSDYNKLLGQLVRLKNAYHHTHRVTAYSANREQQINDIISYAGRVNTADDKQLFEKYVLILGKYKEKLDLVRKQHVKGIDDEHPNGTVKQFVKSHFTHSGLVTVMEQALVTACPFIVAKAGFFGGAKTNFEHPYIASAQAAYHASRH